MRCSIIFFVFQFCCTFSFGQNNLIPNGSFEELTECPTSAFTNPVGNIEFASPWWNGCIIGGGGSPDIVHLCMSEIALSQIENNLGLQQPSEGLGFAGIVVYSEPPPGSTPEDILANWGEYISCELIQSLLPYHEYKFNVHLSLAQRYSNYNLKSLQVALSYDSIISQSLFLTTTEIANTFPDYEDYEFFEITGLDSVPYDGWQEFEIVITPTQIARHIAIGTFKSNYQIFEENELVFSHEAPVFQGQTYYFIDEVSLVEVIDTTNLEDVHKINVRIFPNPVISHLNISNKTIKGSFQVAITDATGRIIQNEQFSGIGTHTLNLSGLAKGIYYCRVLQGEEVIVVKKVVVTFP